MQKQYFDLDEKFSQKDGLQVAVGMISYSRKTGYSYLDDTIGNFTFRTIELGYD